MFNLAMLATVDATVQNGVTECLSALDQITALISKYPFNVFFGCSILFIGIAVFAKVRNVF